MFSSTSHAEWTRVATNIDGTSIYVDFDRMKKHDGYVYYWELADYPEPIAGDMSVNAFLQGDCKLFRTKVLSFSFHKEPMGGGRGNHVEPDEKRRKWRYPPPHSTAEATLKFVCNR